MKKTKNIFNSMLLCLMLLLSVITNNVSGQVCSGSWSTNNVLSYDCVTGQFINGGFPIQEPPGCPANPVYTSIQTTTFTFTNPVSGFSIDFNAFSTAPDCGRMEIKINAVFYNLAPANFTDLTGTCSGSFSSLEVSNGYIIGGPGSLQSTNGQGKITITGVNATSVTVSTNDPAGSVISTPYNCINIVPLKLESFIGKSVADCKAILNWQTGIESNVKFIEVWRSTDGAAFKNIARVLPKGSNSKYELVTDNFSDGFFKLKTIDLDGHYEFSNIIKVRSNCETIIYSLAPNPAHNSISIEGIKKGDRVMVQDMLGRTVLSFNSIENNLVDIHTLSSGSCILRVVGTHEVKANLRFIKD